MKRILFATLLLCGLIAPGTQAQSWSSLLKGLVGGSKEEKTEVKTTAPARLTADLIAGKWMYAEATLAYTGSDMLAQLAVAGLQGQASSYFSKAGLVPGRDAITFGKKNDVTLHIGGREAAGTYSFNSLNGTLVVTLTVDGKSASFRGTASLNDGLLLLLFDANETLHVVRTVSPSAAQDSNVQTLGTIIEKYPGLLIGGKLKK